MSRPLRLPALVALACLAAGAARAEVCHYGTSGTNVRIAPHGDAWAEVVIDNRLAARTRHVCELRLDGLTVSVRYLPGSGAIPDDFEVIAPEGYIAIPARLRVDDGAGATVLIRPLADLPLG